MPAEVAENDIVLTSKKPHKLHEIVGGLSKASQRPWDKAEFLIEGASLTLQCTPEQAAQFASLKGKQVQFVSVVRKKMYDAGTELHLVDMKAAA